MFYLLEVLYICTLCNKLLYCYLFQEHKWKMYLEIDEEDDDDINILTCIRDVTFVCKQHGAFKLNHPPYIMEKWCVGVTAEMNIDCTVNFEVRGTNLYYQNIKKKVPLP